MAISQIAQGVFLVSPDKTDYRDSQAYRYTQIFSKATQRQLDLSREQALFNAKLGISAYEAEMDVYRTEYTAMSKRIGDVDKSLARAGGDLLKAQLEIRKNAVKAEGAEAARADATAKARAEQQTVPQGSESSSQSTSSGGGGEGGVGGSAGAKADDEVVKAAIGAVGAGNAGALLADLETRGGLGQMSNSDPKRAKNLRISGVSAAVNAKYVANQRDGMTPEDALKLAELDVKDELSQVNPAAWNDYSARGAADSAAPDGGRTSQSSSSSRGFGSEQLPKYKDLADSILGATPERQAELMPMLTPEELTGVVAELKARRDELAGQLAGLTKPKLAIPDLITESRKIAAGRFGPTRIAPAFAQRNALDAMLRMTDEQFAEVLKSYRASSPEAAPAAAPAATPDAGGSGGGGGAGGAGGAAPAPRASAEEFLRGTLSDADREDARRLGYAVPPAPADAAAPLVQAAPPAAPPAVQVSAPGIFSAPTTELDALVSAPLPGTEGMRATARPMSLAESFFQSRQPPVYAGEGETPPMRMGRPVEQGGGVSPSIGEKGEGPVPASMRPPLEFESRRTQEYNLLGMDEGTARALAQRDSMALEAARDAEFRRPAAAPAVTAPERVAPPSAVADVPTPMARGAAPPAGLGTRVEGALLPRVQGPPGVPSGTPTQAAALDARGRGPLQGQTPGMITAGTNIIERKSERTAAAGKAAKDLEAAAGAAGKTGVTAPADAWIKQRLDAAQTLVDQPDKLKRLRASEAGRLAEQYFQADRSKGFSAFYTARTTIPAQMADKPDLRDRAAEVALALAIQDIASKNPK